MKRKKMIMIFATMVSLFTTTSTTTLAKEENAGIRVEKKEEKTDMMMKIESKMDFDATVSKIESFLKEKNIALFYTVDHEKNALDVGLPLGKTKVFIFGDPKVGTLLMQDNPEISYDLPLRLSVFQEGKKVYLVYRSPIELVGNYELKEESKKILEKMDGLYQVIGKQVQE